jgi:hypothetical protein
MDALFALTYDEHRGHINPTRAGFVERFTSMVRDGGEYWTQHAAPSTQDWLCCVRPPSWRPISQRHKSLRPATHVPRLVLQPCSQTRIVNMVVTSGRRGAAGQVEPETP